MDTRQYKIKRVLNKAIICFVFVLMSYLLLSIISYKDTNLINGLVNNDLVVKIINAIFMISIFAITIGWLILNKEKFKLKPTIVFVSLILVYTVYYFVFGMIEHLPFNELLSNIKNVLLILIQMYFVIYVLANVIKLKHIKIINAILIFLVFVSFFYVIASDFQNIIATYADKKFYDFSTLSPFLNKNLIGIVIFLAAIFSLYIYSIEKKKAYIALYIFLFIPNILSLCKASIVCMALLTIFMLFNFRKKSLKQIIFQALGIFLILDVFVMVMLILFKVIKLPDNIEFFISTNIAAFETISSRFVLIARSASLLNYKNVWLGNGYASSLTVLNDIKGSYFHNSYMFLLNTGGIALTLLFIFVFYKLSISLSRVKKNDRSLHYTFVTMIIVYIAYSMFENIALFSFTLCSYLFSIFIILAPKICADRLEVLKTENKEYKNIAFITTIYPTKNKKWYGIYLKNIAKSLIRLGHKLNVVYIHEGEGVVHNSVYDGIPITHVYYKPSLLHKFMIPQGFGFKSDFEYIIKKYNFDDAIIHFYPPAFQNYMITTLKENGVKVLHYIHSRNIWKRIDEKRPVLRKLFYNNFYKRAYKKCDNIICVSKVVENDFKTKLKKAPAKVVYNGVDSIFFNDIKNIKKMDDKQVNLISVANLYSIKGHKYVLEALKDLVNKHKYVKFKYLIIGNGMEKNNLKQMVKDYELNRNVTFVDEMSQEKIKQILLKYDIFILPSYYEALGCVYLEAMASGCYTIGCKHQGISEIITPCNGYLVDEYSSEEIVITIEDIINNVKHNSYIRRNAIKTAKEYTWMNSAKELSKHL
ncbi:MAG: glycosyltransferase [Erysipelotrichales bacterium]|nr:glycosyltransferase [Erysipelotrichales bacterium]